MTTNILDYLERSAKRFPDKVAFGDLKREITYCELVREAKAIGTAFAAFGFRNQPVAVVTDHSVECLVTFLGIVYSGNFYVPVDGKLPAARIKAILGVAQPQVIVVPRKEQEKFLGFAEDCTLLVREEIEKEVVNEEVLAQIRRTHLDTDPLYLIFTSGSTGIPKGVLICHRSVIDLAEQFAETFGFDENEVFANQAPFDFDVSVKDIYSTLRNGASLYIVPQSMFSMPKSLFPYLNEHKISTVIWAVSALSVLAAMKVLDKGMPQYLKKIMFSGEVMPVKILNYWRTHLPEAMFVNLYGPTEITCNCTYYILDREFSEQEVLPIGQAFKNTEILLLKEDESDTVFGETGEICVRGTSLAHGYYRNPEATAKAFRQNPRNSSYPEMIYHTGDYGRFNEQGQLMFAARKDWQIKHMGHRIELAEIESAVNAFEWIARCCCQYDEEKGKIVLIYEAEEACDKRILQELQNYLPKYMCPNRLVWMKKMPLNQRGKTDRVFLKNKFSPSQPVQIYQEAVVLGSGSVALACAQQLKEKNVTCVIYDTGDFPAKTLERQAQSKEIPYYNVSRKELAQILVEVMTPTLVVSAINPWIVPEKVVDNPYLYIINCHQALLPAHPGRNAEMWAIFEGDSKTGITWHQITAEVDAGDICIQKEMELNESSTSFKVFREQSRLAIEGFAEILDSLLYGTCQMRQQKCERGQLRYSYEAPQEGILDLKWPFEKLSAFLRAYDYGGLQVVKEPCFMWDGQKYTFKGYHILREQTEMTAASGEYYIDFKPQAESLKIQSSQGSIELRKIMKKENQEE